MTGGHEQRTDTGNDGFRTGETVTERRNGPTGMQGAGGRPAAPGASAPGGGTNTPPVPDRPTIGITRPAPAQNGSAAAPTAAPATAGPPTVTTAAVTTPAPAAPSATPPPTPPAPTPSPATPATKATATKATATEPPPRATTSPLRKGLLGVALVLLLLAPAVVAGLLSAGQPSVYEARAEILYQRVPVSDAQTIERELATQQVLLRSEAFVSTAAEAVDREQDELEESISVEVIEESSILQLAVRDEDRDRALAAATSLVDQYIAAVEARSAETATATREKAIIQPQIDAATARLAEISARLAQLASIPVPSAAVQVELRDLESERGLVRQQLSDLNDQILEADRRALQESASPTSVVTPPFLEEDPVGPQPLRAAAAGLLVGIVLVAALLAGLRQRNRRSRSPAP